MLQGILIGYRLAFVTISIFARVKATEKNNGWITMFGFSKLDNGMLLRGVIF